MATAVKKEHKSSRPERGGQATFVEAIRQGIWEEMERDSTVFVIGEDMAEQGGVFGVRGFDRNGDDVALLAHDRVRVALEESDGIVGVLQRARHRGSLLQSGNQSGGSQRGLRPFRLKADR